MKQETIWKIQDDLRAEFKNESKYSDINYCQFIEAKLIQKIGKEQTLANENQQTEQPHCHIADINGLHYCPKCGMKLHSSGQCVNQLCSGFSRNACR